MRHVLLLKYSLSEVLFFDEYGPSVGPALQCVNGVSVWWAWRL